VTRGEGRRWSGRLAALGLALLANMFLAGTLFLLEGEQSASVASPHPVRWRAGLDDKPKTRPLPTSMGQAGSAPVVSSPPFPEVKAATPFPLDFAPRAVVMPQVVAEAEKEQVVPGPALVRSPSPDPDEESASTGEFGPLEEPLDALLVDRPPREIFAPPPRFPARARRRGLEGEVTVRLVIDEEGRVVEAELVRVMGDASFGDAALEAVRGWRYTAAWHRGRVVRVFGTKTIAFRLEDGP